MNPRSRRISPPLLLAALTAALLLVGPRSLTWRIERSFHGVAPASSSLAVNRGWEVHLDLRALDRAWHAPLEELLGEELLGAKTPPLQNALGNEALVWSLARSDLTGRADSNFRSRTSEAGAGARASATLSREGVRARTDLYQSPASPRVWSGPLSVELPAELLSLSAASPEPNLLRQVPADSQRLVWINFERFTFTQEGLEKLSREWDHWEPEVELAPSKLLGPELVYLHWRGSDFLLAQLRDRKGVQDYLAARFPSSLLPVHRIRSYGNLMTGFLDGGPAWLSHGQVWYGSPQDGFEALTELRSYQTGLGSPPPWKGSDLFLREVRAQLAKSSVWDVVLLENRTDRSYAMAAGLVWESDSKETGEGFLVLEAKGIRLP